MNKKRKLAWIIVPAMVLVFGLGIIAGAAGTDPGSDADPLITKSYFDSQVSQFKESGMYHSVNLSSGDVLSCAQGTEIVLASGEGKAASALLDVTEGEKLSKGKKTKTAHSYVVTSANGGMKAAKASRIFVKGTYKVK